MENTVLAKLKEFIKSKVELEKKLIGQVGFLRELVSELTDLVESIESVESTNKNTEVSATACDVSNSTTSIIGRVGLKIVASDGGVIFRIDTEDGFIDFLYYGEDRNVLAPGMKVYVSAIRGENGAWIARKVEIID